MQEWQKKDRKQPGTPQGTPDPSTPVPAPTLARVPLGAPSAAGPITARGTGPLTRLVQEARSRPGGPDWLGVARRLADAHAELGAAASAADVAGALRALPDEAARAQAAGWIGAAHGLPPEALLGETRAQPAAPPPPAVRSQVQGAGVRGGVSSMLRAGAAAPAVQATPTPRPAVPKPSVPAPLVPAAPRQDAAGAAPTHIQTTTSARRPSAGTQVAPPAARKGSPPGGKVKSEDLHVLPAEVLRALPTGAKPVGRVGGRLVFDAAGWKQVQGAHKQARAQQAQRKARKRQEAASGQEADHAPSRPTGAPQVPAKLPAGVVRGADMARVTQKHRQQNTRALNASVARARRGKATLAAAARQAAPTIRQAVQSGDAQIAAALSRSLQRLGAQAAKARATVTAKGAAARAGVTAAHTATVQGIRQDRAQKEAQIRAAHTALMAHLAQAQTSLAAQTNAHFNAASGQLRAGGGTVAGEATATGERYANQYASAPLPEQSTWDKLKDGGDYEKNKRDARVKAARETGAGYAKLMGQTAEAWVGGLGEKRTQALASNRQYLQETFAQQADAKRDALLAELRAKSEAAITAAGAQRQAAIAQIEQAQRAANAQITAALGTQTRQARAQAAARRAALKTQANARIQAVQQGAQRAEAGLDAQIAGVQGAVAAHLDQPAAAFAGSLRGFEAHVGRGVQAGRDAARAGAQGASAALKAQARPAAQGLDALAAQGGQALTQIAAAAGTGLTTTGKQAATGLRAALTRQRAASGAVATEAKTYTSTQGRLMDADARALAQETGKQLETLNGAFLQSARQTLQSGDAQNQAEVPAIEAAANKAAGAVQPRWKAVASVAIDVVVAVGTIAAIVALGAVLGPVGLLAAGVLLGAVTATAGQAAKDLLLNGELSDWKTYGAAALGGAIGGLFGGAGGLVGGALSRGVVSGLAQQGLGTVARFGARVATEAAVGTAFDLGGQVVTGYANQAAFDRPYDIKATFSVQNILQTSVMNSAGTVIGSPEAWKFARQKVGAMNFPGKGLIGEFHNTLAGSRPAQAVGRAWEGVKTSRAVGALNALDQRVAGSRPYKWAEGKLEGLGQRVGTDVAAPAIKNTGKTARNFMEGLEQNPQFFKLREQYRRATDPQEFREAVAGTQRVIEGRVAAIKDPDARRQVQELLAWVEANPHQFSGTKDGSVFYSGGSKAAGNRDLALGHGARDPNARLIDNTSGGQHLEGLRLYERFAHDTSLADIVWMKASQQYARNARGGTNEFVAGARPDRVYGVIENPVLSANPRVGDRVMHPNPGIDPTGSSTAPKTPVPPAPSGGAHGPFFDPASPNLAPLKDVPGAHGGMEPPASGHEGGISAKGSENTPGLFDKINTRVAETTGSKHAPLRQGDLAGAENVSGRVSHNDRQTSVAHADEAHPLDRQIHEEVGLQYRRDHSPVGRAKDWVNEKLGGTDAPRVRTEGYYAEMEAEKLRRMAEWRTQKAQDLPLGPERDRLLNEAANLKNAEAEHRARAEQGGARTDPLDVEAKLKYPDVQVKATSDGYPQAPEGHYYVDRGEGFSPRYQLKQRPNAGLDTDQARQIVIKDGVPTLETRSARDVRQERLDAYRNDPVFERTRQNHPDLNEDQLAYSTSYETRLRGVLGDKVPDDFFRDVLSSTQAQSVQGADAWEKAFRQQLRDRIIRTIDAHVPADQYEALHDWLGAQPNSGAKGELFNEYRERHLPDYLAHQKPEVNDTSFTIQDKDGNLQRRSADGVVEVNKQAPGGPPPGKFLVDDKSGAGAFKGEQLKNYVVQLEQGGGKFKTLTDKEFDGVVYFFDSEAAAISASNMLKGSGRLENGVYAAFYNRNMELEWVRADSNNEATTQGGLE